MKAYIEVTSLHVWCLDIVDLALYAAACRERQVFYKRPRYVGTGIICAYIYIMYVMYAHVKVKFMETYMLYTK